MTAAPDLVSLGSYVRFYQTVLEQLDAAWKGLFDAHAQARDSLQPFASALAPLELPLVTTLLGDGPPRPTMLDALWRPEDGANLSGLTDVYEVVGRFSFQGIDNENLARVQTLVSAARNEIHGMRARLQDLSALPAQVTTGAERLSSAEDRLAERLRAERLAGFQPLGSMLIARARQTMEAVRAVPAPMVDDAETAADEWRRYAVKVQQVYATCLPFLQKALATLFEHVGAEIPASWPEALPLVDEMPAELLSVPPADSPELSSARASLQSLAAEESALSHARDDIGTNVARLDGEIAALTTRDGELRAEVAAAMAVVDHADVLAQLEEIKVGIASYEQQKSQRVHSQGEVFRRNSESQSALAALEDELSARARDIAALTADLDATKQKEPVLFGKDEWRGKVAGLEEDLAAHRATQAQRLALLNQIKIDLSSISVQLQTEQTQLALLDRWIADAQKRGAALQLEARTMEAAMGPDRPARVLSPSDARELLEAARARRAELAERIERLLGERRRQKEEVLRIGVRLGQIEAEGQRSRGLVASAEMAETQGREAALRQLVVQRRTAVAQHLTEVLGGLEQSLGSIEHIFLEPAQRLLLSVGDAGPRPSAIARDAATKLGPLVETLLTDLEPQLLATDAMLGQIQREFCDVAPDACSTAFSS